MTVTPTEDKEMGVTKKETSTVRLGDLRLSPRVSFSPFGISTKVRRTVDKGGYLSV